MYEPPDASSSAIASSVTRPISMWSAWPVAPLSGQKRDDDVGADPLHLGDDAVDELVVVGLGHAAVGVVPHDVPVDAEVEAVLQGLGLADVAEVLLAGDDRASGGRPRPASR